MEAAGVAWHDRPGGCRCRDTPRGPLAQAPPARPAKGVDSVHPAGRPVRRARLLAAALPRRRHAHRAGRGVGMTTATPTGQQASRREQTRDGLRLLYLRARVCIERHYAHPLTLGLVARATSSSPRQLERAFRACANTTFRAELTRTRLGAAARLLASQPLVVSDV